MHDYLVFQLQAPLSSWGEPAVGEFRGSATHPGQSALVGLLGAALGLDRSDEAAHATLRDDYGYCVGLLNKGSLLRDYHTAQVPPRPALKGRPQATRRQEMAVPKRELSTILSARDYRQNAAQLVALQARADRPARYRLSELADALRTPRFVLYLGRKSCAPAAPLWPQVLAAESARLAFGAYAELHEAARVAATGTRHSAPLEPLPALQALAFDAHIDAGAQADLLTQRKDRLIRRKGWQFGDREEQIALLAPEET